MKTLILHIGAHKTGSSSIQHFLKRSNSELQAKGWSFFHFPGALNLGQLVGWKTEGDVEFFFREEPYSKFIANLSAMNSNCIVSCEDMFFINKADVISRLEKDLRNIFDRIIILVYLRRQDAMAISQKAQGAKTVQSNLIFGNSPSPLPELTASVIGYLEYDKKMERWSNAFGQQNLRIRFFERHKLIGGDAVADFLATAALPLTPSKIKENKSLGPSTTAFLQLLRASNLDNSVIWPLYRSHVIQRNFGSPTLPSRSEVALFLDNFRSSNRELGNFLGKENTFDLKIEKYPDERENYTLDVAFSIRNCRRSIRHMRRVCNKGNYVYLRELSKSAKDTHPQAAKLVGPLADRMYTAIVDTDKLQGKMVKDIHGHNKRALLDDLIKEIEALGNVVDAGSAQVLYRAGNEFAATELPIAYELTRMACIILPHLPHINSKLSTYRTDLQKRKMWSLTLECRRRVDRAILQKNMARSKIMSILD